MDLLDNFSEKNRNSRKPHKKSCGRTPERKKASMLLGRVHSQVNENRQTFGGFTFESPSFSLYLPERQAVDCKYLQPGMVSLIGSRILPPAFYVHYTKRQSTPSSISCRRREQTSVPGYTRTHLGFRHATYTCRLEYV